MSEDKGKYAELVSQLIPVNELPVQIQKEVLNKANILKVRKGGHIFKQGDRDDFSYYLLEGEIELHANGQQHNVITGGSDRARYAMAHLQPRQFAAKAKTSSVVFQILRDSLDKLMVLHEKEQSELDDDEDDIDFTEVKFGQIDNDEEVDWMTRMLQSELFSKIPTANVYGLFALLEPLELKAGETVIKQGDPGEHYYIIQGGRCQVTRRPPSGGKDLKLAELKTGDGFGEEALISETTRNANVSMLTDGIVMRLSKDNFVELVKNPILQSVSYEDALKTVDNGAGVWLDVRFKNEHKESAIEQSLNIPLNMLRMQSQEKLPQDKQYIVYCDTGGRSSTAAFLMTGLGYDVSYLQGGLVNNPQAAKSSEVTQVPKPPPEKEPPSPKQPEISPEPELPEDISTADEISKQELDPEVKASVLEAELVKTNMKLKDAEQKKGKTGDKSVKEMQQEVERRLQEERAKIEVAKKQAEEEARRLRELEEAKIKKMQEEAAKRLQEEKQKLEAVYSRNAEEMENLQKIKQDAEEQLRNEKARLEKEAEEAKRKLEEAQRIKKEVEASKRNLEKEALKRQQQQQEMEKKIQQKAQEKLAAERQKLAEQFAQNQHELEEARQEKAAAEAARKAAKSEAEKIIAQFKAEHDKDKAMAEQLLKEERLKLEEEQRKIQETLKEIKRAREEAEAAKKDASLQAKQLRARQNDTEVTQSKHAQESLKTDIKVAEDKINKAKKEIAQAQQAQVKAVAAKKVNENDLIKQKVQEEELKRQLTSELEEFREDLEEQEKEYAGMTTQLEHMKRIKERAEAAKNAAKQANANLLDEIQAQLDQSDN